MGPSADDDARPLRSDAARNRERIIAAARELFASRGLGVGLNEIAHHAGLGVGTVYRRFPDKQALIDAALEEPLRRMRDVAGEAQRSGRAWDGLVMLLTEGAALLAANLGLRDVALTQGAGPPSLTTGREGIAAVSDVLLERARDEGDLRPGITGEDILVLLWMLTELAEHSADVQPDAYARYLRLVTDGLRDGPERAPLPPALTGPQVAAISHRWATR